ncbi:hypothetical protein [Streptomyces sp. NPDC102283]|uniref:hypothetical protein n=1 Tax=Streptomyces sp. NPDC102283 TaxID=3366155 RepID=UPI0037F54EE6
MTTTPTPDRPADQSQAVLRLLEDAEGYLSALHGAVGRHDHIGADLTCGGCALRDRLTPALAVARQLLGTTTCGCPHPADEHSVYGCAEDCACEWMPPKTPAAAPPAPADRAAEAKAATTITRLRAVIAELNRRLDCLRGDLRDMETCVREQGAEFERIRRLADDAAAGVQPPTTSEADSVRDRIEDALVRMDAMVWLGCRRGDRDHDEPIGVTTLAARLAEAVAAPPAAPAAPEERAR